MNRFRRRFLILAAGAVAAPTLVRVSRAETYPARRARIVVGFPASNASDIIARLAAQALSEKLGQTFIVDNRPGAGGNVGVETVVNAPADGYTLVLASPSTATNATLYTDLTFNFIRDIAPVGGIARAPYILVVNPSFPATSVAEFIAYAKANPGKINMASAGNGSFSHLCGEMFMAMAGIDMVHVPYRNSFIPDLLAGQVQTVFSPISQSIEYIRAGKLRALAVTVPTPEPAVSGVPAVADFLPGFEAAAWYGLGAPKATPADVIATLDKTLRAALAEPDMQSHLIALGAVPMPMTAAAFGAFVAAETEKWGNVIRAGNIHAD